MKRNIIRIDEEKCNGCGLCLPNCQEGALQLIDGKARLVSDLFCDGLGACLGHCPEGAITIEEREAEPYSERIVMKTLAVKGRNTILAHLEHLRDHNEQGFLNEAISYIKEKNIDMSGSEMNPQQNYVSACPGATAMNFNDIITEDLSNTEENDKLKIPSELRQWPVQLHLLNPQASYFKNADVILAADCVAFALGNFHSRYLKGNSLAIACPKLDTNKESYLEKLTSMIADTKINSLHVMIMEVPCCGGLSQLAKAARNNAGINIPIKQSVISIQGEVLKEEWV